MKICPKCNSLCEDSASFCQECGAPLPAPNDNAHTQENQKQQELVAHSGLLDQIRIQM